MAGQMNRTCWVWVLAWGLSSCVGMEKLHIQACDEKKLSLSEMIMWRHGNLRLVLVLYTVYVKGANTN